MKISHRILNSRDLRNCLKMEISFPFFDAFSRIISRRSWPIGNDPQWLAVVPRGSLPCRCLVKQDDRESPSFLFESVVNGSSNGRFSFVGARPALEVTAMGNQVVVLDHEHGTRTVTKEEDPIEVYRPISHN